LIFDMPITRKVLDERTRAKASGEHRFLAYE